MKTSMRYLAVIFAVAMMLCALTVSANKFEDVKNDTPHAKAIENLTSLGIIHGYEDNTFKPTLPVRRDEMAKLVYTTYTTSTDAGEGVTVFPDVDAKSWAKGYISWCAGKNIVGGYPDGTFIPEGNVTLDEALKMVCAMLGYTDFNPQIWPIDVRVKALIDLNLGEGLEDVAGNAALTRAQVAQLFHNALDEQMYVPTPEITDDLKGSLNVNQGAELPTTLATDVWGYKELNVRVVGTENYYIDAYYKVKDGVELTTLPPTMINDTKVQYPAVSISNVDKLTFSKTGRDDAIIVAYLDEDDQFVAEKVYGDYDEDPSTPDTYVYEGKSLTIYLDEIQLESYAGKTDDLIARDLKLFINKKGEYFSSTLQGKVVEGITGGYGIKDGISENDISYTHDGNPRNTSYSTISFKIDGVDYLEENFAKVRNLVFLPDGQVLCTPTYAGAHAYSAFYVDNDRNLINRFYYPGIVTDQGGLNDPEGNLNTAIYDYKYNFPSFLQRSSSFSSTRKGIDSDGDGYYDYVTIAFSKAFMVESVSRKTIVLKPITGEDVELPYSGDAFHSELDRPVAGDIIIGHIIGDDFYHETTTKKVTGFATKKSDSTVKVYGQGSLSVATNIHNGRVGGVQVNTGSEALSKIISANPNYIGINPATGTYTYITYYLYNGNYVYATLATESEIKTAAGGQNKAILQFVDKPTDLQINEKTKEYEIFYPAYLLINGKEELVNLKPTAAINGAEGATIAQDGTKYRAYVKDGVVMYPNILVEFEVDSKGYYSLKETAGEDRDVEEEGKHVGKVLGANGYYLTINPSNGIMSIEDKSGTVVVPNVIADTTSVLYFPYLKKTTGIHEHMNFCFGNEIPSEFNKIELIGDTYLKYDATIDFYVIETTVLALNGFDADNVVVIPDADDYEKDARLHLLARAESEAVYDEEKEETYASYNFKGIFEDTDVETINTKTEYSDALKTETNLIYAWDAAEKDYVKIDTSCPSYLEETITYVMSSHNVVVTDDNTDGYKVTEDTKVIAIKNVPNEENNEFIFEEITVDDLDSLLGIIEEYNDYHNEGKDYTMSARIGTYVDENKKTQLAYIIVDWVEYNEELEAYTFAGKTND